MLYDFVWIFQNKSHNMKALVVLSPSWPPFLTFTCLYRENELMCGPVLPSGELSWEKTQPISMFQHWGSYSDDKHLKIILVQYNEKWWRMTLVYKVCIWVLFGIIFVKKKEALISATDIDMKRSRHVECFSICGMPVLWCSCQVYIFLLFLAHSYI